MIYAELLTKPGGTVIEKGVFLSIAELCQHDAEARKSGQCWSGSLETNIALNRYRDNRCINCGCMVGETHKEGCRTDVILTTPNI